MTDKMPELSAIEIKEILDRSERHTNERIEAILARAANEISRLTPAIISNDPDCDYTAGFTADAVREDIRRASDLMFEISTRWSDPAFQVVLEAALDLHNQYHTPEVGRCKIG